MPDGKELHVRVITGRVITYIESCGMSFESAAAAVGIGCCDIDTLLEGRRSFTAEEYVAMCEYLHVPYSQFAEAQAGASGGGY